MTIQALRLLHAKATALARDVEKAGFRENAHLLRTARPGRIELFEPMLSFERCVKSWILRL